MNTILCILFVLCVAGFSLSSIISPTAQTWLRDRNPRTQVWNYVLLGFAVLLANFIRLPLLIDSPFATWAVNLAVCALLGAFLFLIVCIIGVFYRFIHNETCM